MLPNRVRARALSEPFASPLRRFAVERQPGSYPDRVTDSAPRPRRPALSADLVASFADALAGEPAVRSELASATAAAVVSAGRAAESSTDEPAGTPEQFVTLADRIGLETLAELWRDAEPGSLPGSLWTLYLLRTWCRDNAEEVARLWRAGRPYAPADEVVAGVADDADPGAMLALADAVLAGAYRGDFAVALERAAAFFRVVATGRRESAAPGADGDEARDRADRNDRAADGLATAALRWREGVLS
jgi:hypothetical protein